MNRLISQPCSPLFVCTIPGLLLFLIHKYINKKQAKIICQDTLNFCDKCGGIVKNAVMQLVLSHMCGISPIRHHSPVSDVFQAICLRYVLFP